jgi:adenylate cyclase
VPGVPEAAVDFEAEGLLEGVEGDARTARLDLLERLVEDGVPIEELKAACREDRLAFLPLERAMAHDGRRLSANDIARESGLSYEALTELWRALGMAATDPDDAVYSDEDLEAARVAQATLEAGVPKPALLEILRVAGHGMSQLAATITGSVGEALFQPGVNERDAALGAVELERATRPHLEHVLSYALRIHQLDQMRSEMISFAELSSGRLAEGREMTVCFADLVGFTRLGEEVPPDQLSALAGRFSTMAREAACGPVRLVKTIGDAAMLVSPDTEPLLETALTLLDDVEGEGEDFPQIRVGIARGPALSRAGDWYGRSVNLASRVSDTARRGSILATGEVRQCAERDHNWSNAGVFRIKGVRDRVPLWRLRRAEQAGQ